MRTLPCTPWPGPGSASSPIWVARASPRPCRCPNCHQGCGNGCWASPLVIVSKTNRESTVHRRVRMDYVGVRLVGEDGELAGELRLLGLFTSKALMEPAREIPLIRRKLDHIMESEDLFPGSHDYKAVVAIFESFPKDELFASGVDDLRVTVMALLAPAGEAPGAAVRATRPAGALRLGDRARCLATASQPSCACGCRACSRSASTASRSTTTCRTARPIRPPSTSSCTSPRAAFPTSRSTSSSARCWRRPARGTTRLSDALVASHGEIVGHALARRYAACSRSTTSRRRRSSWPSSTSSSSRSLARERRTPSRSRTSRAPPSL